MSAGAPDRRFLGAARALLLPGLLSVVGCFSEHTSVPSGGDVSFADDVEPILVNSCATSGCHGANANPPGKPMVLLPGQAYDNTVGVLAAQLPAMPRIRAGQPDDSYLIHKIRGTHVIVGGAGSQMPLGRAPLSAATIELIRSWVADGAPRN